MDTPQENRLHEILSQATAPFREGLVSAKVQDILDANSVPYFHDSVGNLILGVSSRAEYRKLTQKKSKHPLRIFIAHMDHPGFHGIRWKSPLELEIKWHGGSPTQFLQNAPVWISHLSGTSVNGKILNPELTSTGRSLHRAEVLLTQTIPHPPQELFGGFQFQAPWWQSGELIYTQAADDLIGVFAIVELAIQNWGKKSKSKKNSKKTEVPCLGLLTRAEEVGFIGALAHFELGWLTPQIPRGVICISLETSRTLPGAEIGKGPVVRLGDRYTVFDPSCLRVLIDLAEEILPQKYQCRIMDGGTCEGTAATVYGFRSIGLSIPLGNYHNQNFEGTPNSAPLQGPAPEFVHRQDIEGLLHLTQGLLRPTLAWPSQKDPWRRKRIEFKKELRNARGLL